MPLFHSNCMIVIMPIILLVKPQSIRNILRLFLVGYRRKKYKPVRERKEERRKGRKRRKEGRKERERGKRRERRKTSKLKSSFNQLKKLSYSALDLLGNR